MIRVYSHNRAFYIAQDLNNLDLEHAVWLDLFQPTQAEEVALENMLGFKLPTPEEMRDIEPSSRLYTEEGVHYMTATILAKGDSDMPQSTNVSFILHGHLLITIRYYELRPFALFQSYADKHTDLYRSGPVTLVSLLEAIVDRIAEKLEETGAIVDNIATDAFARHHTDSVRKRRSSEALERMLTEIAYNKNLTVKIRDSLFSLTRLISYLNLTDEIASDKKLHGHIASIIRDVHALTEHNNFLTTNISFVLDACLGFISIQQNSIIKIFSIASVVLLPPTLIASIYGMNFQHMPELQLHYGYPVALGLMALSAALPYLWFKCRGWL